MFILYNIIITIIYILTPLISLFVPKLKLRNRGLKSSLNSLIKLDKAKKTIWFHSSSVGEFEQAKPLIELIKKNDAEVQILCTFFSPSGYNSQKNYPFADVICYLPFDFYFGARSFLNKVDISAAIFIRYELWFNYFSILRKKNVPIFLINATYPSILLNFISNFIKNKLLFPFYKSIFSLIDEIYTIKDTELFNLLSPKSNIYLSSDTRNDRIVLKVTESVLNPVINKNLFNSDELILVCGSIWATDVDIIFDGITRYNSILGLKKIRLILVPHEPDTLTLSYIQKIFPNNILLSELGNFRDIKDKIILVDSIGVLLKLYGIADIAYIGGGFGVGIHSITEPAGYGVPLIVGSNCFNSPDANKLLELGALERISGGIELMNILIKLNNDKNRLISGTFASNYIKENTGSTLIIYNKLKELLKI